MPTKTEAQIVNILGWMWLAALIPALAYGGAMSLAVVTVIGIAAAAAYLEYRYRRTGMFHGRGRQDLRRSCLYGTRRFYSS